jgi:hypothetical protein
MLHNIVYCPLADGVRVYDLKLTSLELTAFNHVILLRHFSLWTKHIVVHTVQEICEVMRKVRFLKILTGFFYETLNIF